MGYFITMLPQKLIFLKRLWMADRCTAACAFFPSGFLLELPKMQSNDSPAAVSAARHTAALGVLLLASGADESWMYK